MPYPFSVSSPRFGALVKVASVQDSGRRSRVYPSEMGIAVQSVETCINFKKPGWEALVRQLQTVDPTYKSGEAVMAIYVADPSLSSRSRTYDAVDAYLVTGNRDVKRAQTFYHQALQRQQQDIAAQAQSAYLPFPVKSSDPGKPLFSWLGSVAHSIQDAQRETVERLKQIVQNTVAVNLDWNDKNSGPDESIRVLVKQ